MTRTELRIGLLAVSALAFVLAAASVGSGAEGADAIAALTSRVRPQTTATESALALANDLLSPRIAGLGLGLSVGLAVGGVGAYVTRGDSQ